MKPFTKFQTTNHEKIKKFAFQITSSSYSLAYTHYLKTQFHTVQYLIKGFLKHNFRKQINLKYPLQALLKGVCKKLLLNTFQFIVYAYFLSQVQWRLDHYIYNNIAQVFPNVIHVNQPTDPLVLKQLSMFLYFSSFSIKQFLCQDIKMIKQQMIKVFPQFQHLQAHWTSTQQTIGHVLNPKILNYFFKLISKIQTLSDYNICVDKILQISPCYDITGRGQKKQLPSFGFTTSNPLHFQFDANEHLNIKVQDQINDYRFDGQL